MADSPVSIKGVRGTDTFDSQYEGPDWANRSCLPRQTDDVAGRTGWNPSSPISLRMDKKEAKRATPCEKYMGEGTRNPCDLCTAQCLRRVCSSLDGDSACNTAQQLGAVYNSVVDCNHSLFIILY